MQRFFRSLDNKVEFYILLLIVMIMANGRIIECFFLDGHTFGVCPFKWLTGCPCPGCGMTRAVYCLLKMDLSGAFYYNMLSFAFVPLFVLFSIRLVIDVVLKKDVCFRLYVRMDSLLRNRVVFFPLLLIIVFVWVKNIINGI